MSAATAKPRLIDRRGIAEELGLPLSGAERLMRQVTDRFPLVARKAAGERLCDNIVVDQSGCWLWTGLVQSGTGYGKFYGGRIEKRSRHTTAHRAMYEVFVGPVPDGLQLDHLCRNRLCVRPGHLEPVTLAENLRRGESPSAKNARLTHCANGHPYDEENTYYRNDRWGKRMCRACNREAQKRYQARKKASR